MRKNKFVYLLSLSNYEDIMKECTTDRESYDVAQNKSFWETKMSQYPPGQRQSLFNVSVQNNYLYFVKILLSDENVDPQFDNNYAIRCACYNGYSDIVRLLIPYTDVTVDDNYCLRVAVENNHNMTVYYIMTDPHLKINPSPSVEQLAKQAYIDHKNVWMTQVLSTHENISLSVDNSILAVNAVMDGNHELVDILLKDKSVDFSVNDNYCLQYAVYNGDNDMLMKVLGDKRVDPLYNNGSLIIYCMNNDLTHKFNNLYYSPQCAMSRDTKVNNIILETSCAIPNCFYLDIILGGGKTPTSKCLHIANSAGNKDHVKILLRYNTIF